MADLADFEAMKERAAKAKEKGMKAEGALAPQIKRLKDEFQCETTDAGEVLREQLKMEYEQANKAAEQVLEKFNEEWGDKI